jgi:hypothetical protein
MSKHVLRKSIACLGGCLLLVMCLQVARIPISPGQYAMTHKERESVYLQPGKLYFVRTSEEVELPEGTWAKCYATFGTGFHHSGKHKSKDKLCNGDIDMRLRDNGDIEYKCVICGKSWIKKSEVQLITDPNEN